MRLAARLGMTSARRGLAVRHGLYRPFLPRRQGHSKNPSRDGLDGFGSVFAEVFARGRDGPAKSPDHGHDGVAKGRERPGAGADSAAVFVHADVAHVMQFVFDGPVVTDQCEQPLGSCRIRRQARDQIDDFGARLAAGLPCAFEPGDLTKARPIEMGYGFRAGRDGACLDPSMRLVERPAEAQVRRQTVETAVGV